ncbi:hypothetical protein GCM10009801_73290 [Streptomyces albiaxialis]|uniref:Uncharacterized protein n=1 Tax=Streptomyces albiaxialis TaxID=329523 RepID=A0ABN2WZZ2_9ACTN
MEHPEGVPEPQAPVRASAGRTAAPGRAPEPAPARRPAAPPRAAAPAPEVPRTRVGGVSPADLCRWGADSGQLRGSALELCRGAYGR